MLRPPPSILALATPPFTASQGCTHAQPGVSTWSPFLTFAGAEASVWLEPKAATTDLVKRCRAASPELTQTRGKPNGPSPNDMMANVVSD